MESNVLRRRTIIFVRNDDLRYIRSGHTYDPTGIRSVQSIGVSYNTCSHCTFFNTLPKPDPKNRRRYICEVCEQSTAIFDSAWTTANSTNRKRRASSSSSSSSDSDIDSDSSVAASAFSAAQVPNDFPPLANNPERSLALARRKKRGFLMSDVDRILSTANGMSSGKGWFLLLLI